MSPSARMKPRGMGRPEIGKFCTARWVCAPHSASAGTRSSPMLSCSMRSPALPVDLVLRFAIGGLLQPVGGSIRRQAFKLARSLAPKPPR
jgi:hypothetical protein